jgi:hypothetical protein
MVIKRTDISFRPLRGARCCESAGRRRGAYCSGRKIGISSALTIEQNNIKGKRFDFHCFSRCRSGTGTAFCRLLPEVFPGAPTASTSCCMLTDNGGCDIDRQLAARPKEQLFEGVRSMMDNFLPLPHVGCRPFDRPQPG